MPFDPASSWTNCRTLLQPRVWAAFSEVTVVSSGGAASRLQRCTTPRQIARSCANTASRSRRMSSDRSGLMRKCSPSARSYDSPRATRMLPSPCALISAPSFSPTLLLSAKISQLDRAAGADFALPAVRPDALLASTGIRRANRPSSHRRRASYRDRCYRSAGRQFRPPRASFVQEPYVSLDAIEIGFLQMGVTPQMQTLTTVDPNLIYMSGHVGALFIVSRRISGDTRSKGLKASVQKGRMELTGVELSMRSIGNSHFTQHFTIASAQPSDALEGGAVIDTTFAKPQIVVLSGDLL